MAPAIGYYARSGWRDISSRYRGVFGDVEFGNRHYRPHAIAYRFHIGYPGRMTMHRLMPFMEPFHQRFEPIPVHRYRYSVQGNT